MVVVRNIYLSKLAVWHVALFCRSRLNHEKKGTYVDIGGMKTYKTGPESATAAMLVIYNIFGFGSRMFQVCNVSRVASEFGGILISWVRSRYTCTVLQTKGVSSVHTRFTPKCFSVSVIDCSGYTGEGREAPEFPQRPRSPTTVANVPGDERQMDWSADRLCWRCSGADKGDGIP